LQSQQKINTTSIQLAFIGLCWCNVYGWSLHYCTVHLSTCRRKCCL